MVCTLHIARYPRWLGWAGLLSMAWFRLPLWLDRRIGFYKLMGSGRNGTFDKTPDWGQWAVLYVSEGPIQVVALSRWWRWFGCTLTTFHLEPIEGHGSWDGKACFGDLPRQSAYEGRIAVLTRATIRFSKLGRFWQHVDPVAEKMKDANGFSYSIGIGEVPWIKQATFSVWESKAQMQDFAYRLREHADVVRKTRTEGWYSEEMFVRFRILNTGEEGRRAS